MVSRSFFGYVGYVGYISVTDVTNVTFGLGYDRYITFELKWRSPCDPASKTNPRKSVTSVTSVTAVTTVTFSAQYGAHSASRARALRATFFDVHAHQIRPSWSWNVKIEIKVGAIVAKTAVMSEGYAARQLF